MVLLFILIFLLSVKTVFATPSVSITSVPEIVVAGNTFPVSFTINEASSSASYYYKFFGGIDTDVYKITNNSNLSYTSSWTNFPQATLNPNSSQNIFNGFAFVKADAATGTYNLKIKIALTTNTGTSVTSPSLSLEVAAPSPTPTSSPTNTPAPTSTPTPTPTPTNTPTPTKIPTSTITPTIADEEINTDESFVEEDIYPTNTDSPTPQILGESTTKSSSKINIIPLIFIITGALLLLTPLIITKLKKQP